MVSIVKRKKSEASLDVSGAGGGESVAAGAASANAQAKISAVVSVEREGEEPELKKGGGHTSSSSEASVDSSSSNSDEDFEGYSEKPQRSAASGVRAGKRKAAATATSEVPPAAKASSLSESSLVIPDDVDTTELPKNWRDVVLAELAACGVGADEEYEKQLAAYDSSDDEAGDPPQRAPARKRLAIVEAAKHYKIGHKRMRILIRIVDANLAKAGLPVGCGKRGYDAPRWTKAGDKLILTAVKEKMSEQGISAQGYFKRLPNGFWRELKLEKFPERTESAIYQRWKDLRPSSEGSAEGQKAEWTAKEDDDLAMAVEKERNATGLGVIRSGFWPALQQQTIAHRSLQSMNKRLPIIEKMRGGRIGMPCKGKKRGRAASLFTEEEHAKLLSLVKSRVEDSGLERLPFGFWDDIQKSFPNRTKQQLYDHWSQPKKQEAKKKREAKASKAKASSRMARADTASGDSPEIVALSPVDALGAKYPPGTSIVYRPSSDVTSIPGRVMKVEMHTCTAQDGANEQSYVYTVFDDNNGNRYERVPEHLLEERD